MGFALRKPPNFSPKLKAFPYQMEAITAARALPYAAIFHEQGLGKTKIAIDLVLYWLEESIVDTVFIVTKKSLVKNWIDEIRVHSHLSPRILSDDRRSNSHALNSPVLLYVLNYEVCLSNQDLIGLFLETCRVGVILDESQKIKNPDAKLTKCFLDLSSGFQRRIIMTGTPVANRPQDIWSQIKFLDEGKSLGDDFQNFKSRVDIPDGKSGIKYGESLQKIRGRIRGFSLRETKETSGIELPEKTVVSHRVDLSPLQKSIYSDYRDNLRHEISTEMKVQTDHAEGVLKLLLRLVQCAANPFLVDPSYDEEPAKYQKLRNILDTEVQDRKAIIWTNFIANAEWLAERIPDRSPVVVHGQLDIQTRNAGIDRFKSDRACSALVATPGAAKEGLTLTVSNYSIFYDRSFSLDDYLQAQDRIHRISQECECFVYNLIARDTIDEWVDRLLYAKFIAAQIAQGDASAAQGHSLFNMDLSEMLSEILGRDNKDNGE